MEHPFVDYTRPVVISHQASYQQRAFATRFRKFPIIGQVKDVDGYVWDIRDVRTTRHGFDLYFGTPADDHGAFKGGLPRLIDTPALYDFWDQNRTRGHGFLFDLPAGRTTLKRARRRLGFNFDNDVAEFWSERLEDLKTLRTREFAAKHGLANHGLKQWMVSDRRKKLVGPQARPIGWWRTPETIGLLLGELSLNQVKRKLGISTSQVHRLRRRAMAEYLHAAEQGK